MKIPIPNPFLLATALLLAGSAFAQAESPQIARAQGSGEILSLWGVGLADEELAVFGGNLPFNEEEARAFLKNSKGPLDPGFPAEPPPGSSRFEVLQQEERGLVATLRLPPGGRFAQPDLLWVRNSTGTSRPIAFSTAKPWMLYPEIAQSGQKLRIFGNQLARVAVGFRPQGGGEVVFADLSGNSTARNTKYELDFHLPGEIKPGEYEVFVHNGQGGAGAWGGPLSLTILETPGKEERKIFDVREFGAKGDGRTDDSEAIRAALVAAGEHGHAEVFLPAGRYPISRGLWVPEGVHFRGLGGEQSVLVVLPENPMVHDMPEEIFRQMPGHFRGRQHRQNEAAMLWMRDHSRVEGVGFEDGPGVLHAIFCDHTDVQIIRCKFRMRHASSNTIFVEWGSYGLVIKENDILTNNAGIVLVHGPTQQAYIGYNHIRSNQHGFPLQGANLLFLRAPERTIVEENFIEWGDRNFCSQLARGSSLHHVLIGNTFYKGTPRRHNAGETMYEGGSIRWFGTVRSATETTATFAGTPFSDEERGNREYRPMQRDGAHTPGTITFAFILDGRGIGQYRQIVEHDDNTLTVEPAWDIQPDETTVLAVVSRVASRQKDTLGAKK